MTTAVLNPLMHIVPKWSDTLAAIAARFLKCADHFRTYIKRLKSKKLLGYNDSFDLS